MANITMRMVIVGAGPGGAMLAYLLASRGGDQLQVTLVERQHDFEREFRGEVLMPSGIDVIRQAGLMPVFESVPRRSLQRAVVFNHNRTLATIDLEHVIGQGVAFTAVSQPAMLEMLVREASRFPNFVFERGVAVRDLIRHNDRVAGVEVVSDSEVRSIDADLVVGADGRASVVRRKSRLDAVRWPQSFDIVWCKVPAPPVSPTDDAHTAQVFIGDRHFALAFPTHDDRLQIAWVIRKGAVGELRKGGIEHWIDQMAGHVSTNLAAHLRSHLNDITQPFLLDVICDLMPKWTQPGMLLIGDAAHPMSPVGGQGINIALRDAVVAANHLVDATRRNLNASSFDHAATNIQRERMPEVKRVQRLQQFPPRLLFGSPLLSRSILKILPLLISTGIATGATTMFMRRLANGVGDVRLRV